jgi:hypothetical protein
MRPIMILMLALVAVPAMAQERIFRATPLDVQQNIRLDSLEEKVGLLSARIDLQQAETLDRLGSIEQAIESIKSPVSEPESVQIAATPEPVEQSPSDRPAKATVIMYSIPGCGWCDQWQIKHERQLLDKGWAVQRVTDTDRQFAKYPSFRVFAKNRWQTHNGYMSFTALRELLGEPVFAKTSSPSPVVASGRYSTEELRSLIQQHRPGGWRGPVYADVSPRSSAKRHLQDPKHGFTYEQVAGLTQEEALILHDLAPTHGNKIFPMRSGTQPARREPTYSVARPVINRIESGCANGQCARGAKARTGLFGLRSR